MSRQENHFHRVKELLSDEQKNSIVEHFYSHKESYDKDNPEQTIWWKSEEILRKRYEQFDNITFSEFKTLVTEYVLKTEKRVSQTIKDNPLKENKAKFYKKFLKPEMFDSPEIKNIEELYFGEVTCFLYTNGSGITVGKHTDRDRNCCLTIPLVPDYTEYRSCYFYENYDDNIPLHTLDYSKMRSPVLLNNKKIHCVDNKNQDKPSLCVQVEYEFSKSYIEIRKMLSEKGLLI